MRNFNFSFRPGLKNTQNGQKNSAHMSTKNAKGITLVALVVTIVVLLILAGITITMLFGENGIIKKAQDAADATKNAEDDTINGLANLESAMNAALGGTGGGSDGDSTGLKVKLANGTTVTLTKENFGDYLGKKVTNYKTVGGTENVTVTTTNDSGKNEFTVSTTYRLYYVDFDNKYGDGAGTVYLKADCTGNNYALSVGKNTNDATIKNLNPELYKEGVSSPASSNNNMKAVTWLLDTTEWAGLVTSGSSTAIADKVNYVVGAPSLEMMMDSYNAHYGLESKTIDASTLSATPANADRPKLFYSFTSGNNGYKVGPSDNSSATNGMHYWTKNYSIGTDSSLDTMYYPENGKYYWLASPCAAGSGYMVSVSGNGGGRTDGSACINSLAFCPLVSLKSNVQLELAD